MIHTPLILSFQFRESDAVVDDEDVVAASGEELPTKHDDGLCDELPTKQDGQYDLSPTKDDELPTN